MSLFLIASNKPRNVAPLLRVGIARRSMVHKQLVLLLHSRQCVLLKEVASLFDKEHKCHIIECEGMSGLYEHCDECSDANCTTPLCGSSKEILDHWHQCQRSDCGWCGPLLKIVLRPGGLIEMAKHLF